MSSARHRRRQSRTWQVVALVLLLTAAGFLTLGLRGHEVALPGPVATQDLGAQDLRVPAPELAVGAEDTAPTSVGVAPVPASAPVALRIPAISVDVELSTLGLNTDRTVEVPADFDVAGWFGLGPTPGQNGSAVILGHVDSFQGPAVFYRLRTLRPGDEVNVSRADGTVAHFRVTTVATYNKDQFPAQQVYGSRGESALQLVTCGGDFDTRARSYLSNVVAYTTLTAITGP